MSVPKEQVEKIAELARLKLAPQELESLSAELSKCFDYFDQLNEVNTDGVEPLHHIHDVVNITETDVPHEGLTTEEALRDAPERTDHFFKLPRVISES